MPRAIAQTVRTPRGATSPLSVENGSLRAAGETDHWELRAGLSYSFIDLWRGRLVGGIAEADCGQHSAGGELSDLLLSQTDRALLPAHRARALFLTEHRVGWQALLKQSQASLESGAITLTELHEIWQLADELERRRLSAEEEVSRLELEVVDAGPVPASLSAREYLAQAGRFEREASRLRSLDAWSFNVAAGAAPFEQQGLDWFLFAELSYNFGDLARRPAEARYLSARQDELREGKYELPHKLERFRQRVATEARNTQRRLELVESELAVLRETLQRLDVAQAPINAPGRVRLNMEQIALEADAVFLRAQSQGLAQLVQSSRDS